MVEFARYFIEFLKTFWNNLVLFFGTIGKAIGKFFGKDIADAIVLFFTSANDFNFLDWLIAIFVWIINIAFVVFLVIWLYQIISKYFKFRKREIEKDELIEEIATLSQQNLILTNEKNEILKLKMETFGMNSELLMGEEKQRKRKDSRFTKLTAVDEKYDNQPLVTNMIPVDMLSLKELVNTFINFSANKLKLYYSHNIVRNFFAGMGSSQIIILEGISGTGKTSLPYAMGQFFTNPTPIIPVQPSWRDRSEMIGYLNEFTKKFNESDFLKELYEVNYRDDINFIVLDEMNLARIEYYFADFLSVMEMPDKDDWKIDIVPSSEKEDPVNVVEGKITVPQNVWFVGTANKDDSTFTISDKVYDRATSIEMDTKAAVFEAPETESIKMSYNYIIQLFEKAKKEYPLSEKNKENIEKLDEFITRYFKITFGNRITRQINHFVPVYVAAGGTELEAIDYIVTRKIFRKFESLNLPFLQDELEGLMRFLDKVFGKNAFKEGLAYVERLKRFS